MKWQWSLLVSAVVASPVLAQVAAPAPSASALEPAVPAIPAAPFAAAEMPPGLPSALPAESSAVVPDLFPGPGRGSDRLAGNHKFDNFINWMSNPLQNIDPRAVTAVYPIFGAAWLNNTAPIPDATGQIYGPAMTIALSERFAMGLNQGGYAAINLSHDPVMRQRLYALDPSRRFRRIEDLTGQSDGFLNIGGFFQYTLVEDVEDQFILTGGIRYIIPCGSYDIYQGHGPLQLAPYLTAGKELEKFHILGTFGYQFPAGPGNDYVEMFNVNLHIDRQCFGFLYPLVEFNMLYHTKPVGFGIGTRTGLVGLGNFEAEGNIATVAAGLNAVLVPQRVELGAVYTTVIASQRNFEESGLLVKMTLRY